MKGAVSNSGSYPRLDSRRNLGGPLGRLSSTGCRGALPTHGLGTGPETSVSSSLLKASLVHIRFMPYAWKLKKFRFGFARTWLEIWNRVDRGPFTIQGQKGNEIGRLVPKLSTISWCGFTLRNLAKNNLFFLEALPWRSSPVHAEMCVSQCKLSWQICYNTCVWHQACNRCVLSNTVCLPAQQEKTLLSVSRGQRTNTPRHICGALCRDMHIISA